MALQGAFVEHEQMLQQLGVETFEVRSLSDWLLPKDGLILPGGESTTQVRLLSSLRLLEPLKHDISNGMPVFGTCAGMILLSRMENGRSRQGLATMDVDVCRNAYGRQLGSFQTKDDVKGIASDYPMTFIRAPYIHRTLSSDVEVMAMVGNHIVAVRQNNQLATAFHPELTTDDRMHRYFLNMCKEARN
jgi:5'-phosphate synthase pdxT subunit